MVNNALDPNYVEVMEPLPLVKLMNYGFISKEIPNKPFIFEVTLSTHT